MENKMKLHWENVYNQKNENEVSWYQKVPNISLEIIAIILGFSSVWFSKNNSIWVYPTGMISTSIYVYLLFYLFLQLLLFLLFIIVLTCGII